MAATLRSVIRPGDVARLLETWPDDLKVLLVAHASAETVTDPSARRHEIVWLRVGPVALLGCGRLESESARTLDARDDVQRAYLHSHAVPAGVVRAWPTLRDSTMAALRAGLDAVVPWARGRRPLADDGLSVRVTLAEREHALVVDARAFEGTTARLRLRHEGTLPLAPSDARDPPP
jgi:hypothetical protein